MSQIEEMKTTPEGQALSAPELAAQALDQELKPAAAPINTAVVNDLSGMVKKKKKPAASETTNGKRKADEEDVAPTEKKARLEDDMQTSSP